MSTVDADTSSKISEAITSKGGCFVEAPASGSKKPTKDGQLVILAAGDKVIYILLFSCLMEQHSDYLWFAAQHGACEKQQALDSY
ncbi:glyoxylatesuccinic semialdehyde reductase 1 [Nicotiana attenuata]|uniref:Glyoxylatesuccinic semialdehyde reductase 1 n=1 Tax=Nicotiana attenuata TaxID=49451 RepID=A0A1J6KTN0_NICAT|nr:glyoxylatesuccinic semialdehyde reductase 1 [Nicotiana attenuata]